MEWGIDVLDLLYYISLLFVFVSFYLFKVRWSWIEFEWVKWKLVMGIKGNEKREFFFKSVGLDGKFYYGVFVFGNLKL